MIKFDLQWDEKFARGNTDDITRGKCTFSINEKIIWNDIHGIWIEFLKHLIVSWDAIFTDGALKSDATEIDKLEFELNHDLGKGVKGQIVPSIIIYRYGNNFEIQIGEEKQKASYNDILRTLNFIGDKIVQRIRMQQDLSTKKIIENWNKRKK